MEFKSQTRVLFSTETVNIKIANVVVREVKVLNQLGKCFQKSIKEFNTPKQICGFIVSALGPLIAQNTSYVTHVTDIENMLKSLNDPSVVIPEVEKCMEILQSQRTQYIQEHPQEFKTKKAKEKYLTDWLAKYEIGDLMQISASHVANLFFVRYVSFQFPDLVKDVKHEEKNRLKDEEKFRKERFVIESAFGTRKLQTLDDWAYEGCGKLSKSFDKPLVFIGDLMGHYVTFLACKLLREDGTLEDTLFLLNSLKDNHISYQEIIFSICQLAFPESVFGH